MSRALLVIAKAGFQDHELQATREALLEEGFHVILASTETGSCIGKFRSVEEAVIAMKNVDVLNYDRIAFIGGPGAAALADDESARALCFAVVHAKKPLGAICIAPTILAKARVLQGKNATVWDDGEGTQIGILEDAGAIYTGEAVTVDGMIVTGNGPEAAELFGKVFAAITTLHPSIP